MIKKYINKIISKFSSSKSVSKSLLESHLGLTYGDQKGQVDYLINNVFNYEKNGLRRNGFFIDLACGDGVYWNNTFFLEKFLNWKGILFEPNPKFKNNIIKTRVSKLVTDVISDEIDKTVPFRIDNGMLGGIVDDETDNNPKIRGEELKNAEILHLKTTTLENELMKFNAPKVIDYLSLDVEGSEWIIMKKFPFDKYKFRCLTVERPNKKLDILFDLEGYRQIAHLMYDVVYVYKDYIDEVNFNPRTKFAFTPSKDW